MASVTFADPFLGSLSLTKTGNDTAYWRVAGAVFTVTGPAPSTAAVGTLTVGDDRVHQHPHRAGPRHLPPRPRRPSLPGYTRGRTVHRDGDRRPCHHDDRRRPTPSSRAPSSSRRPTRRPATPWPGATFDIRYDSPTIGTYNVDLGTARPTPPAPAPPPPNDGTGFLPGNYEVIETARATGLLPADTGPDRHVTVDPAGTTTAAFTDALLVPASFTKVATGTINPTQLVLVRRGHRRHRRDRPTAGHRSPPARPTPTATAPPRPTLISGQPYCWSEVTAPPGLPAGATGCFVADNAQGAQPITVTDAGEFVAIAVKKVDAADPTTVAPRRGLRPLPQGRRHRARTRRPHRPARPPRPGQTWVAQATTGTTGVATFPLQLPGYAYCAVETQAPANYVLDSTEHCTTVLRARRRRPAPVTTLTVGRRRSAGRRRRPQVQLGHADNRHPRRGLRPLRRRGRPAVGAAVGRPDRAWPQSPVTPGGPGGRPPTPAISRSPCRPATRGASTRCPLPPTTPSIPPSTAPPGSRPPLPPRRRRWPSRSRWPWSRSSPTSSTRSIPGPPSPVPPTSWSARARCRRGGRRRPTPTATRCPPGDWYVGIATTDGQGDASWSVPAGYSWCMHEVSVPAGYQPDPSWHCTAVISTTTPPGAATMALPETPIPAPALPSLPYTGSPAAWQAALGGAFLLSGGVLLLVARRRKRPVPDATSVQPPGGRDG